MTAMSKVGAPQSEPSTSLGGLAAGFLRSYYIYLVLVGVVLVLSVANLDQYDLFERGNFLYPKNLINVLRISAPLLLLAGAFCLLMVSGYIDLSVGSAMSLSAVVYALLAINGVPFAVCFAVTVLVGVGLGAINGFLVVRLRITPVIATLITLSLFKGIALLGGVAIAGGFGSVIGMFFGALILAVVTSAATGLVLSPDWQFILKAVAVFLAIVAQTWALARRHR